MDDQKAITSSAIWKQIPVWSQMSVLLCLALEFYNFKNDKSDQREER